MNVLRARVLALCAVPVYLCGAAWPLRLEPPRAVPNGARVDGQRAAFDLPGVLRGDGAGIVRAARAAQTLDVSLRVIPASADQTGPARILELGTDHDRSDLMVGQSGDALVVRVRRPGSDGAGGPPLVAHGALKGAGAADFELRLRSDRATLLSASGGELAARDAPGLFTAWYEDVSLCIGDSPVGERSWRGVIERAEIRAGALNVDLLAPGVLERPDPIWRVPERLRHVVARGLLPPFSAFDLIVNVLFFVPIGWLATRAVARRPVRAAVAFGLLLSLAMETSQIAFADRVPSLVDLATNVLGAVGGAWAAVRIRSGPARSVRRPRS